MLSISTPHLLYLFVNTKIIVPEIQLNTRAQLKKLTFLGDLPFPAPFSFFFSQGFPGLAQVIKIN